MVMGGPGLSDYKSIFGEHQIGSFTCRHRGTYAACSASNFNTRDGFLTGRKYARMEVIGRAGAANSYSPSRNLFVMSFT